MDWLRHRPESRPEEAQKRKRSPQALAGVPFALMDGHQQQAAAIARLLGTRELHDASLVKEALEQDRLSSLGFHGILHQIACGGHRQVSTAASRVPRGWLS